MGNKIALVTGGTKGIGLAIVKALKQEGYKVAVVGRSKDAPDCDLYIKSDLLERDYIIEEMIEKLGGIDILINNAGEQEQALFIEYEALEYDIELMVYAPFYLSQKAAKYMLTHDGGHIINILSTAAFQGARNVSGYVVAKHALLGMTRAMAVELAPKIRVNAIAPGLIDTNMTKDISVERKELLNSITPAGRFGTPEDIAGAVMYLLGSNFVYGTTIIVDGGWCSKNG